MVNPSFPRKQLVGVSVLELARFVTDTCIKKWEGKISILHSLDGYDEIYSTGLSRWSLNSGERLISLKIWELKMLDAQSIVGERLLKSLQKIIWKYPSGGEGTKVVQ